MTDPRSKAVLALTLFADNLRGKGQHDLADEIEAIAEDYDDKGKAPKKKKP
jgi:hypothetical protein